MGERPTATRRRFLLGTLGLGVSTALARHLGWWEGVDRVRLAGLLEHQDSARVLGVEYLRAAPAEADAAVLTRRLLDELPIGLRVGATEAQLRSSLARRGQQDFRDGCTIELDGWVVSVTEARLCGLAALRERPTT